jgi:two-component system sensor histidine kinase UhpB
LAESGSPVPSVDFLQLPLGAIAEAAHCAIVLVDAEQSIVAINEAAARIFGCTPSAILGQPLASLVPESRRAAQETRVEAFEFAGLQERRLLSHDAIRARRANGQEFPAEISISRVELLIEGRQRVFFVAILRDLSDERDLRVEVAKLNARMRAVLDLMPVPIWIIDAYRIVYANRTAAGLFGLPDPEQLVGRSIHQLLDTSGPVTLRAHIETATLGQASQPALIAGTLLRTDGQTRHVEIATSALPDHGRTVLQMVIIDVTESRNLMQEQAQHRQELRRLAASVVEAREEERRRIARELHDELGQRLTALKMEISALRNRGPGGIGRERITGMLEMVDSSVSALRRIAADLRPLILDDLGLNAAIEWLARDAARRLGIEVTVHLGSEDPPLAQGADIALYRMVQEALTNVGRHSGASDVHIELDQSDGELRLTVRDNGTGFPDRSLRQEGRYGLLGMRERALALGGRLDIDTPPGGGGRITVHLPLAAQASRPGDPT